MKNVVFSKFSNERGRAFAIRTDILKDENGKKSVRKTACYPEGASHVRRIAVWCEKLTDLLEGTHLRVNKAVPFDEASVELEYLEGGRTLEEEMYALWRSGKKEEAGRVINQYLAVLKKCAVIPFARTREFSEIFGEVSLPGKLMCMPVTDIDMVLENILLADEQGEWQLIDYEWTFDFPIPVHFVIYRVWRYFLSKNADTPENFGEYLAAEGISQEEAVAYGQMEKAFQKYVTAGHMPIREMYSRMTPGCITMEELGFGKEAGGGRYASTLSMDDVTASRGDLSGRKTFYGEMIVGENGDFVTEFELKWPQGRGQIRELRWDPLEGKLCRIRIDSISSEIPLKAAAVNAFTADGRDVFWTYDPVYRINGSLEKAKRIRIKGNLQLIRPEEIVGEAARARMERDAYYEELERVRGQLAAIRRTKGFMALEGARRARNFVAIRAKALKRQAQNKAGRSQYQQWYEQHRASKEELKAQRNNPPINGPKISILVPTYKTPLKFLREMIDSVRNQTYANWELCIADGGSPREVTEVLAEYAGKDPRIKYLILEKNGGISENTNGAAVLATGDYIALLDHDDILPPEALFEVAYGAIETNADVIYTDEDKISIDSGKHFDPHMKPDFAPDLLCSHNYITHFFVVRRELFDEVGGFRKEFDGAQDYDLVFRCTERADVIYHIPKILYHWRMHRDSTAKNPASKMYAYEAGKKAIEEHLRRIGRSGRVEMMQMWGMNHVTYETPGDPLVSVVIPNKDHVEDLDKCIRSILNRSSYQNLEIVVVENNSQTKTFAYYKKIREEFPQVRVVRWKGEFNYSAINNYGVRHAKGKYLLLLNNDTELISPDAVSEMLGYCMRKDVGCVGAKLLYADDTVQHMGIVLGFGGFAGHVFSGMKKDDPCYMSRAVITGNFSAVTAACMMVRRDVYEEMGGFSEEFAVALNDVDFCMKVRSAGYLIVCTPFALWHHYESKSRGYEDTPEKQQRFQREVERFRNYWGDVVDAGDPYYNPNFSVDKPPFVLE